MVTGSDPSVEPDLLPRDVPATDADGMAQPAGEGVPGAFPALAGNKLVQGDPKDAAWIVTHGRGGMPNFAEDLDDAQVASILTFLRSSWGNKGGPVAPADIKGVRGQPAPPNNQAGLPFH